MARQGVRGNDGQLLGTGHFRQKEQLNRKRKARKNIGFLEEHETFNGLEQLEWKISSGKC